MARPLCVRCRRLVAESWNGRPGAHRSPQPVIREARYLVHVGASQVERFECEACQAATQNRIVVDLNAKEPAHA